MPDDECERARNALETRRFVGWTGLPAKCSATDLLPGIDMDLVDRPVRFLGDEFEPATFVLLDMIGWYRPMASFRSDRIVMFDGATPELGEPFTTLSEDLGTPEAELDWDYGTLPMPGGERAYASRGITVFVSPRDRTKALHVALYQPTSIDNYQRTLRPHLGKRPFLHHK